MITFLIGTADSVKVGDIITVAAPSQEMSQDIAFIGKVRGITFPHEEITEFSIDVFASRDGKLGHSNIGVRNERQVGIIRKQ